MKTITPSIRTYRGKTIFRCDQRGIGPCDGTGWHVEAVHGLTGMPYAEELCPRYRTLRAAREAIREWTDSPITRWR